MVEPLFRLANSPEPVAYEVGNIVKIDAADAKHAVSVRRMRVGEAVQLSDGQGLRLRGVVATIDGQAMSMSINEVIREIPANLHITLVQALAKGDRDELAIQAATELGAMAVIPWQSERSISVWNDAKIAKGVTRWQTIVSEAAKQSLRAFEPVVSQPLASKQLTEHIEDGSLGMVLVLDPSADSSLTDLLSKMNGSAAVSNAFGLQRELSLIVGPEGGISESELESFEAAGAHRVHLGIEILRTSTAGVAAIAVIQALSGSWA